MHKNMSARGGSQPEADQPLAGAKTFGGKTDLIKTPKEIEILTEGGKILHDILYATAALIKPGLSTWELNEFAEKAIEKAGGKPSFKNYGSKKNPFPAGLCTSINSVVVHGIPSKKDILKEGDIISLDLGMQYENLFTDTALTVPVGNVSKVAEKMIAIARVCLDNAIKQVKPQNRIGDISFAIQKTAQDADFNVIKDLVGHGVGYDVHEDPPIPCFGQKGQGMILEEGMVLAIEPMICQGSHLLIFDTDGWTIRTRDGGLAAHFEHTVAVTDYGARILT